MKLTTGQKFFLSILSAILLSLPWLVNSWGLLMLAGFVPLLIMENTYAKKDKSRSLLGFVFLSFSLWNLLTTWWIANSTFIGAIMAILLNSCFFTIVFWLYNYLRNALHYRYGQYLLVMLWVAFEYIYLNSEVSWPWLTLGNGLATSVPFIQWYEYTGALGGSVWILVANVLIADILSDYIKGRYSVKQFSTLAIIVILPIAFSLAKYYTYKEVSNPANVAVIQPNIDPFHEKFGAFTPDAQLDILLKEASKAGNQTVDFYVGPETAILGYNEESSFNRKLSIYKIKTFLKEHSGSNFIIGAETAREYLPEETPSATARKVPGSPIMFDMYNSALFINDSGIQVYHKTKLVAGVEKVPFVKYFRFLEKLSLKLGGTYGSLGSDNKQKIFNVPANQASIAPVICYESVYGEMVSKSVNDGANLIFIITNDGWFGNSPGYWQHLNYARLRAIENRRSIARSANTGESAFINQRGDIIQSLGWWKRGVIVNSLNQNNELTFYTKHGDYMGKLALWLSMAIFAYLIILRRTKKHFYKTREVF